MFKRYEKLETSFDGLNAQSERFLKRYGFSVDGASKKLFAAFIQGLPQHTDSYHPPTIAACMRKAMINEQAYFLMFPEKREEMLAKKKAQDEQAANSTVGTKTT